jgi:hypothetical protein
VFVLVADDIVRLGLRGDSNARNFEALFLSNAVKFRAPAGTTGTFGRKSFNLERFFSI